MNRARMLNEGNADDAALVFAQLNPTSGLLGVLTSAWETREFDAILQAGEKEGITPESAYEYFTTPGDGLSGLAHSVVPMFKQVLRNDGMLAALNFAMKNGASFDIPGIEFGKSNFPFGEIDQFVMAKAGGQ